jgi:hypothetical protein
MTTQPTVRTGRASPEAEQADGTPRSSSWRVRLAAVTGALLAIRLVLWGIGLAATGYAIRLTPAALLVWVRWDAPHYLHVATTGYVGHGPNSLWIVFFPLYPMLVGALAWVIGNVTVSGLAVSLVASVVAAWFLYKLVALDATPDEARRAVILLFAFPTAYFMSAPYSEAVFIATIVVSIYAARRDKWGWAALAGVAATASRLTGLAVVPALFVEAMRYTGAERRKRLAAVACAPLGFVAYLAINQSIFGNPLQFMKVERRPPWYQKAVPPWHPVVEAVHVLATHRHAWAQWSYMPSRLAAFVFAVAILAWGWRRLRPSDHAFAWPALALSLGGARLISLPRYVLGIYPIFIVLAFKLRNRAVFWTIVGVSVVAQGFLFARYAGALWAF